MSPDRVVVDTNVLISAALNGDGAPAKVVGWVIRRCRLVFSTATFAELETRLWRPKFDRYVSIEQRKLLLRDLASVADWVEPGATTQRFSRDVADDQFVALALEAKAAWLISGDNDLLEMPAIEGLQVMSPADFWRASQGPAH